MPELTITSLSFASRSRFQHIYHGWVLGNHSYARVDLNPITESSLSPSQGLWIWASVLCEHYVAWCRSPILMSSMQTITILYSKNKNRVCWAVLGHSQDGDWTDFLKFSTWTAKSEFSPVRPLSTHSFSHWSINLMTKNLQYMFHVYVQNSLHLVLFDLYQNRITVNVTCDSHYYV